MTDDLLRMLERYGEVRIARVVPDGGSEPCFRITCGGSESEFAAEVGLSESMRLALESLQRHDRRQRVLR